MNVPSENKFKNHKNSLIGNYIGVLGLRDSVPGNVANNYTNKNPPSKFKRVKFSTEQSQGELKTLIQK